MVNTNCPTVGLNCYLMTISQSIALEEWAGLEFTEPLYHKCEQTLSTQHVRLKYSCTCIHPYTHLFFQGRGERAYDIFSRLLKERIVCVMGPVSY